MNFGSYAMICGISVHAIAEAKRPASKGYGDNVIMTFFHGLVQIVLYKCHLIPKPGRTNVFIYMFIYICYNMKYNAYSCYQTTIFGRLFAIISLCSVQS